MTLQEIAANGNSFDERILLKADNSNVAGQLVLVTEEASGSIYSTLNVTETKLKSPKTRKRKKNFAGLLGTPSVIHLPKCGASLIARKSVMLPCFDVNGRAMEAELEIASLCIVGEDLQAMELLTSRVQDAFSKAGASSKTISMQKFCRLPRSLKQDRNNHYIVTVKPSRFCANEFSTVVQFCKSQFIFKLPNLKFNLNLEGMVQCSKDAFQLVSNLGGDFIQKRFKLAALRKNEFFYNAKGLDRALHLTSKWSAV